MGLTISVRYPHPLPLITTTIEQLRTACIFTKLDLRNAYNLICIREENEWKAAFSTTLGHYQYRVMPYGLTCVPIVLQCLINDVLHDFLGKFVIAYNDDILIYSPANELHVSHTHQRLRHYQLYIKEEKCE